MTTASPPTEFEIDGHEYRIGKLSAFQQFHVNRKIAPLIPPLVPVFMKVQKDGGLKEGAMVELLQPLADSLAALPDEAAEYVIGTCLSAIKRKIPDKDHWAPVWNQSGKVLMFADLNDMSKMIPLVVRVIQDSLGPFLAGLLTGQQQAETSAE